MSLEIPNSAAAQISVNINAAGNSTYAFSTPNDVIAAIQQELSYDGLTITNPDTGLFAAFGAALTGQFTATLTILNQSGQELDDTDLQAQFTDACTTLGLTLFGFAVLSVTGPSSGTNSGTGTQGNVTTTGAGNAQQSQTAATPQCGDPALTFLKYPQEWISCLTSKGLTTIGLLAIGLLVGVVLIVYTERRPGIV